MRPARLLLGTALALALAWPARGQAPVQRAVVQTDGAEVRCQPGTQPGVYVTQRLRRGDAVEVVEKRPDGWLTILPPAGSYSWVNVNFLSRPVGPQDVWTVSVADGTEVPVLVGSPFKPGKPDVMSTRLTRGAQVIAVGAPRAAEDGDGVWLPISPPEREYRYVREADVATAPPTTVTTAHPGSAAAVAASPPLAADNSPAPLKVGVGPTAPAATGIDPMLQQAEQLERSGNLTEAAKLYDQLGNKYANSQHDVAMQYYSRAAWLRGKSSRPAPAPVNEADALYVQARQYEQAGNWSEAVRAYNRLGDLYRDSDYSLSMQYYNRAGWLRQRYPTTRATQAGGPPPAVAAGPAPAVAAAPAASGATQVRAVSVQSVGPGRLTKAPTPIDTRPTYLLESAQGQVLAHLVPQPGVDLERYLGQNVEAFGQIVPRGDVHGTYMTVAVMRPLSAQ